MSVFAVPEPVVEAVRAAAPEGVEFELSARRALGWTGAVGFDVTLTVGRTSTTSWVHEDLVDEQRLADWARRLWVYLQVDMRASGRAL